MNVSPACAVIEKDYRRSKDKPTHRELDSNCQDRQTSRSQTVLCADWKCWKIPGTKKEGMNWPLKDGDVLGGVA